MPLNRQFRLAARPVGMPKPSDWTFAEEPVPDPADGTFVVKVLYISLDPAMRGWMNDAKSYIAPVALGAVMRAGGVGRVVASKHPRFAVGEHVVGMFGVQEYAASDGKGVHPVDPALAPLPVYLGALGMPGMTAYFGLLDVGKPKAGDTVVVSGAAGAVGSVVGPDRANQGMPRDRHRRRRGEVRVPHRRTRLRRRDRLQGRRRARSARAPLPQGHRRLLRQRRRRHPRRRACAARAARPRRHLRRDFAVQQHDRHSRPRELSCRCS